MTFKPYSTEGFIYQAPGGGRGTKVSDDLDTIKANFMHLEKLLIASPNPPSNPRVGQLWFDASTNQLKKWDGSGWVGISADTVDGFHASQTPAPNTIPVSAADGTLAGGWIIKAQSFGQTGYVVFANGLIIQWGGPVIIPPHGRDVPVTFPIAFPNAVLKIFVSVRNAAYQMCGFDFETRTGCVLRTGVDDGSQREGHWLAIGF